MQGAHGGPTDDVDADMPAQITGEILAQVFDDARLVGAAGTTARKHDPELGPVGTSFGLSGTTHDALFKTARKRGTTLSIKNQWEMKR
jgi:hypothetical protein